MVLSRFASMVFPEPGGPIIIRLWCPAAATSSALLTLSCPLTSEKSTSYLLASPAKISSRFILTGSNFLVPLKKSTTSPRASSP